MTEPDPAARELDTEGALADPSRRLLARVIDVAVPAAPLLLLAPLGIALGSATVLRIGVGGLFVATALVLGLNAWWLHRYGQTLGKRLVRVRIVRTDGRRASFLRIVGRRVLLPAAIELVPFAGALFAIANPLFIFSRHRRCLHDGLADTIVIDVRPSEPRPATF